MKKLLLLSALLLGFCLHKAMAQVSVHVRIGPPPPPVIVVRPAPVVVVPRPLVVVRPRPVVVVRPAPVVAVARPVRVVRVYR